MRLHKIDGVENTAVDHGKVTLVTDETFAAEVIEAELPVLVDFKADWCGPCKRMAPVFAQLAEEYDGKLKFAQVDVDESPGVANAAQVRSIPTFALLKGNVMVATGVGAMPPAQMRDWIEQALARIPAAQLQAITPAG